MLHLRIAKNCIAGGCQVSDMPQFYLGAISPDAIHSRPGAGRLEKNVTHLIPSGPQPKTYWCDVDQNEYFNFIAQFVAANKHSANADFLLGYGIHILTDMYWTRTVYKKFMEEYEKSSSPISEMQKVYYHDTDIHEYAIYRNCINNSDIWQYLQIPHYANFLDLLTAEEIKLWNERTQNWFNAPENQHKFVGEPKYISALDTENFMSSCAELIISKMR